MAPKFDRLLALGFIFLLFACKNSPGRQEHFSLPGIHAFDSFYTAFHSDSAYQMKHILFPLEGLPEAMDTARYGAVYYWDKETWRLHRPFDPADTTFVRQFQIIDSTLIREVIAHLMSGYRLERRFSFTGKDWQLIYYAPLRQPVRIEVE
jgi:hypothetical protein